MSNKFDLTILTPQKQFYKGEATSIKCKGVDGEFEVLSNHMPLVTVLMPWITEISDADGKTRKFFSSDGIIKVEKGKVEVLCSSCEWPEDIDAKRAEEAKKRAESRLKQDDDIDARRAEMALLKSIMRLKLKGTDFHG
ncbi:F0F1 ATP synthase subunit epsilon [Clostridium oryzae]|uniref:ATP synthase epsilon chain n=1 Tax=Clostridium oryzae TaxID=1450648 RepID=A0A1V4IUD7_9CLOT|nr:F0F1 ATP synthase subunit epsilon [Clostridium oryzae]OPJ63430.1 ATP synthase epsilon chain [Clostridium oryzae]